jgi:hypothetical protein
MKHLLTAIINYLENGSLDQNIRSSLYNNDVTNVMWIMLFDNTQKCVNTLLYIVSVTFVVMLASEHIFIIHKIENDLMVQVYSV